MQTKLVKSERIRSVFSHVPYLKRVIESREVGTTQYSGRHVQGGAYEISVPEYRDRLPDPVELWRHVYSLPEGWRVADISEITVKPGWRGSVAYDAGGVQFHIVEVGKEGKNEGKEDGKDGDTPTTLKMFGKPCVISPSDVEKSPFSVVLYGDCRDVPEVAVREAKVDGDDKNTDDREFEDGDCHIVFSSGEIVMYDYRAPAVRIIEESAVSSQFIEPAEIKNHSM